jgi:hypothetical protein
MGNEFGGVHNKHVKRFTDFTETRKHTYKNVAEHRARV